ncbi:MAG: large subunit ribosomal protein [Acidimicrobiaceae bacterium]|jgi:large subunit ribosomal protein L22
MPAFGVKTNERPGTRAQARYVRMSAYKARQVLDLIRDKEVQQADEILQFAERDAAIVIRKCLASAMANAENNDGIDATELFVSACFADEGPTLKRWRPRARGRATRIRKRTCHITIIVSRLSEEQLERRRRAEAASPAGAGRGRRRAQAATESRRQRVAKSRQREQAVEEHDHDHDHEEDAHDVDETIEQAQAGIDEAAEKAIPAEDAETDAPDVDAEAEAETETTDAEPTDADKEEK